MVGGHAIADVTAKRYEFLAALRSEPMAKPDLVDATGTSRSTVDRAVAELEEHGLVTRENGLYRATYTGRSVAATFRRYRDRLADLERAHAVVGALPPDAEVDPAVLADADVLPSEPHAFGYPIRRTVDLIRDADRVRGVGSAVTPQYVEALHAGVREGDLSLELVLTPPVCDTVSEAHREEFAALLDADRAALYRVDEAPAYVLWSATTAGETTTCIVVYTDAGVEGVVVNDTDAATEWAAEVFERYRERGTRLEGLPVAEE